MLEIFVLFYNDYCAKMPGFRSGVESRGSFGKHLMYKVFLS